MSTVNPAITPDIAGLWSVRTQRGKRISYASESVMITESQVGGLAELIGPSVVGVGEVGVFTVPDFDESAEYRWYIAEGEQSCDGSNLEHFMLERSGTVRLEVTNECGTQVYEKFVEVRETAGIGLDFDGVDDFVLIDRFDLSQVTDFTLEIHARVEVLPRDRVALVEFGGDWNDHIAIEVFNDGSMQFAMSEWEDGFIGSTIAAGSLELDRWYHIAATYEDETRTAVVYVDGVEVAREENMLTRPADINFWEAHLGTSFYWVPEEIPYLDGQMDNFRFWNTVRTAEEIAMNAHCYGNDPERLPTIDYRFQDGIPQETNEEVVGLTNQVSAMNPGRLLGFELMGGGSNFVTTSLSQELCADLVLECEPTTSVLDFSERRFTLVPNPAKDLVSIRLVEAELSGFIVQVYNMMGQRVYVGENSSEIDVSNLATGVYQVLIRSVAGKHWVSKKLVVQR